MPSPSHCIKCIRQLRSLHHFNHSAPQRLHRRQSTTSRSEAPRLTSGRKMSGGSSPSSWGAYGYHDCFAASSEEVGHGGLARGLHEAAKVIEKHAAQLCVLAEDCDQADYVKLVKALCADHNVSLITVPSAKTLGEWAGLCKIDSEGKARKVVGCACVVVKDYGEESEGLHIVQEYVKSH
ncbi:UNVERIFIED_CONTAM: 40S ribosomal protein S12 [Sesamum calycinum]|uniref:40S ribosomal protein S12 n=1 Tax=Sesamum calycinum TaxID=2727403 RepID=A0AAW2R754_9LAMI